MQSSAQSPRPHSQDLSPHAIRNPILRGFRPDPSIVRVGDDFYLATSTFEWFPGVLLHHSRDLVHWRAIGHALTRPSQLDLRGVVDSGGVWAPSLSYADGRFWLVTTNVRHRVGNFKDIRIHLTTAPDITGPWSDPIVLDSIGFDPSLFHDDDGRKWVLNMVWDFRKGRPRFGGIVAQEFDAAVGRLVGPRTKIFEKPALIEGPNLYKRDGWYYLMLAEGGTGWNHGISIARSRSLLGPYEQDPQHSLLTTRDTLSSPLQKAGHGELVETPAGEWYLAHLAARPAAPTRRCILGRETCLQRVTWSPDGWLRLAAGGWHPDVELPAPAGLEPHPWPAQPAREEFDAAALGPLWSSLRVPMDESWLSLAERPGWLRLRGRDSLHSLFEQSLVARRLEELPVRLETCLEFEPDHFTQMAGLAFYYDVRGHYYLRVTHHETAGKVLGVVLTDEGNYDELGDIPIGAWKRIFLRADIDAETLRFSASPDGETWQPIGPALDASKISDDYGTWLRFTGAMAALCVQDVGGTRRHADFDYFLMQSPHAR
jgi:xylan 1,4-beta-xylosidase